MSPEIIEKVLSNTVYCDGGEGSLGHPRVYLEIGKDGEVVCPYCSKKFVLDRNNGK